MNQERVNILKKDILIVDDTLANLRFLAKILTDNGYNVRKALNGQMALTACQTLLPNLILLDIIMPEMDGYEVCKQLKANKKTSGIPVIFLSALDDVFDKVRAFAVGGIDYIAKPFQIEEVLARIENQLTIQHLQNKLTEKNETLAHLNQNLEKLVEQKTQELIEREKTALLGRLTQGMIHNLKNPLQTIISCNDLIALKAANHQSFIKYTNTIDGAATSIKQMMDNLLLKSFHEKSLKLTLVNLNDLLQYELNLLSADLRFEYKLNKKYLFDDNLPDIPLIYTHISQVFHNLINNAIDAMWRIENRELTIITRQDETSVCIDVKDIGHGIPLEHQSKIFEPFYTLKPAKGEEKEVGEPTGTGLGLYTCLELLKPFGGKITVTSEVGKGSMFTVVLPKPVVAS